MNFSRILPPITTAKPACIALLGGGGKTGLQQRLGRELALRHQRVLLTSITKSAFHQNPPIICRDQIKNGDLSSWFERYNPLLVMGECLNEHKVGGISVAELNDYYRQAQISIVECDGARNRPLKVHSDHDPLVPEFCDLVIIIVGADVVGTTMDEGLVHRPERFKELWKIANDWPLTPEFIAEVATGKRGYLTKIPAHMPRIYFINKTDTHPGQGSTLAREIFAASAQPTWYGSVKQDVLSRVE